VKCLVLAVYGRKPRTHDLTIVLDRHLYGRNYVTSPGDIRLFSTATGRQYTSAGSYLPEHRGSCWARVAMYA